MIQLVLLWPPPRLSGWVIEYLGTQKLHQRATTNSYLQTFYAKQHKSLQLLLNSCQIYKSDITAFQHRKRSVLWSLLLIVTNSGLLATLTLSRWKRGSSNLWDLSPLLFMSCCYELLYVAEHVDLLFEARFRVRFHPHHPHHPKRTQSPNPSHLAQGLHEYRSHRSRRGTAAIWSLAYLQRWQSAFHICDKLVDTKSSVCPQIVTICVSGISLSTPNPVCVKQKIPFDLKCTHIPFSFQFAVAFVGVHLVWCPNIQIRVSPAKMKNVMHWTKYFHGKGQISGNLELKIVSWEEISEFQAKRKN